MAKVSFQSPENLMKWLKENNAPHDVLLAADTAIQQAAAHSTFDIVMDNLLDHLEFGSTDVVEFGSHVPADVKVAEQIALRILSDPRLDIRRAR